MIPDVLGYKLEDAIKFLNESGISMEDMKTQEYTSPKKDIIGNDIRVLKVEKSCGKITLVISNF